MPLKVVELRQSKQRPGSFFLIVEPLERGESFFKLGPRAVKPHQRDVAASEAATQRRLRSRVAHPAFF